MKAINLVGFKNSGKTTLALELAEELKKRNIRAAAAKCSHHTTLDRPGRDSDRLMDAYGTVVAMAREEALVAWSGRRYLADMVPLLDTDVLVVEGGKTMEWMPRVLLLHDPSEAKDLTPELALATYGEVRAPGLPAVTTPAELADLLMERGFTVSGIDCGECGRGNCRGMSQAIVAGKAKPEHCVSAKNDLTIKVGGVPLALKPFVKDIFSEAIMGMVRQFKGYAPADVEITIKG